MQNSWKGWTRDKNIDSYEEISFLGKKMMFLSKTKTNFLKILIFGTHGLMTIFNKCSKFQNDLINILGDMTS